MTNETNPNDLAERVKLIEEMLFEGRRTTGRWGWTFVLWGITYLAAIFWSNASNSALAWPVCTIGATILTWLGIWQMKRGAPQTTMGRAIGAVWSSVGIALFLFGLGSSLSPHAQIHITVGGVEIMLGVANAASSLMLRWKTQFGVAVLWWAAGVSSFFVGEKILAIVFLSAIVLCQIVFGLYLMFQESLQRKRELAHA